jgi:hypothetical protein
MRKKFALAAPLIMLFACGAFADPIELKTDLIRLEIDAAGRLTHLYIGGVVDYIPKGQASPLLSLYKDSVYYQPVSASYKETAHRMVLKYANGSVANISVENKGGYLRFQLTALTPRNGIQAVVWGPYATTISESIGETICVVHDAGFAIGMQALDINTIEGLPDGTDDVIGGSFIDPLPGQELPDSLKGAIGRRVPVDVNTTGDMPAYVRMYRGDAAVKRPYGSELRLFARDRRKGRVIDRGVAGGGAAGVNIQYVAPVDVDLTGTGIAFFGCPEPRVLSLIGDIEIKEKLPHPMLDGRWIKESPVPGQAYLMYESKDEAKGQLYAQQCGFHLIHLGDLFQSWGHFNLQTQRFPDGAAGIHALTDQAHAKGIALGVHTLTMFTGQNDPYVSPVPSDSLCTAGTTMLAKDIDADARTIEIADPACFRYLTGTHTVKIGKELINYRSLSAERPWRLLDCRRGQYNTTVAGHNAGNLVSRLVNNSYQGFYPDIHLQDSFARRLANVCNETGLGLMDFDGFGGESPTGEGTYGAARFIDRWYRSLKNYVLTCGAGTFHYYWHIYSFMNWGEPWYNALRQSQVNYRIENQRYFTRNYMPHMLGWFSIGADYRPEEIEWIQARSIACNAGYLLVVNDAIEHNAFKDTLFDLVREWQAARNQKAFSPAQLQRLQDPSKEFHLEKTGEGQWKLSPVTFITGLEHRFRRVQTGEPVATHFKVNNPYGEQRVRMYLTLAPVEGNMSETVSNVEISFNNYQTLEITGPLKAGDKIWLDGDKAYQCDGGWNIVKEIKGAVVPTWISGNNTIDVRSAFSGEHSPIVRMDLECRGPSEPVNAK